MFNRLNIKVTPKKGSALLFFPATETGEFDERVEHEGLEVLGPEDKWIVRIWKHENLFIYIYNSSSSSSSSFSSFLRRSTKFIWLKRPRYLTF